MAAATAAIIGASAAVLGTGASIYGAVSANKLAKEQMGMAGDATDAQLRFQKAQQAKLDKQKSVYRQFQFENPYADIENAYAGLQTQFENVYEDLTVGTQAAEFQMEQGAQQRANIMQGLQGAAGGSGIAGLAQSLANQGALQARQVSVDISRQERQNALMRAQGAGAVQQMEAGREQLIAQGASAADMAKRGGEAMLQEAEMSRQATLLGVEYGGMAGANAGVQAAMANQMAATSAASQMQGDTISAIAGGISTLGTTLGGMNWGGGGGGGGGGVSFPIGGTGGPGLDSGSPDFSGLPSFRYDPLTGTYRQH